MDNKFPAVTHVHATLWPGTASSRGWIKNLTKSDRDGGQGAGLRCDYKSPASYRYGNTEPFYVEPMNV